MHCPTEKSLSEEAPPPGLPRGLDERRDVVTGGDTDGEPGGARVLPGPPGRWLDRRTWPQHVPFWSVHAAAVIGAVIVGWSWAACAWLVGSYAVRMFAITAGHHRYFSHRAFKTSRVFQLVLALLAMSSGQQGVLWWAAHHRNHHKFSDEPNDIHSPVQYGFWWSHVAWIASARGKADLDRVKDFAKYPELRLLDRFHLTVAVAWGAALYVIGGGTALVWGHFVSLVIAWHFTFCINSLAHVWGSRRYETHDESRNNLLLAVVTFGEGWHNNHHHYQRSARQGFHWWQIDITYYVLKLLEALHIVWDVEGVPRHVRDDTLAPSRARVTAARSVT